MRTPRPGGHVIGLDVGSQSVKGCLLDPAGVLVAVARRPCAMAYAANGWAEQDPEQWRDGVATVVGSLLREAAVVGTSVGHLGVAAQVDGVVAVDRELRPRRHAITWLDRRATAETDALRDRVGADHVFAVTGLNLDASHAAPKMMWLRDHEPDVYRDTRWLLPVSGYLLGWLTGAVAQDPANASSTLLYDILAGRWSEPLADAAGLDLAQQPEIAPAGQVGGTLTRPAATALGLSPDCAVVVGTGDEHAAAVAAGALAPGVIVDIAGTAEPVGAVADQPVFDPQRLLETHAHAVDGRLFVENPGFVSGGSLAWLAATLARTQPELLTLAARAPAGADGVLFLPALSGATTPRWNEHMRGAFAGLSMSHDVPHLARAVLEGAAFALRDIVDRLGALGLGDDEIRVAGGGARSALWLQIKADVTGRSVRPVLVEEPSALGAGMLAGVAAGTYADLADAVARTVAVAADPIGPGPDADRYAERYAAYRRLYDGVERALT
jgi:xylulokinase